MALTLADARDVVESERRECLAERDAFGRFRTAVGRADVGVVAPTMGAGTFDVGAGPAAARGAPSIETSARGVAEASLRRSYRQHVMAAGAETDESLSDHVAAELGPDLAEVTGSLDIMQIRVREGAPAAGRTLKDVRFPAGTLVISDDDGERIARPETTLEPDKQYVVAVEPDVADEVLNLLRG